LRQRYFELLIFHLICLASRLAGLHYRPLPLIRNCQLSGRRAPFSGPARLEWSSVIGGQRSSPTLAAAPPTRPAYRDRLS
jgi:hypothetical protein